jgi:nucleotide-binding universal stress UspA family protein
MVAVRDADSVDGLVKLGCEMATGMAADLIALHVVEVGPGLPLDADGIVDESGKKVLARAEQVATTFGIPIRTLLVRARKAGPTIVGEAQERQVDLLVMGYHGPHGLGEIVLGSTVKYLAQHSPCRLIIQVPPLSGRKIAKAASARAAVVCEDVCFTRAKRAGRF